MYLVIPYKVWLGMVFVEKIVEHLPVGLTLDALPPLSQDDRFFLRLLFFLEADASSPMLEDHFNLFFDHLPVNIFLIFVGLVLKYKGIKSRNMENFVTKLHIYLNPLSVKTFEKKY